MSKYKDDLYCMSDFDICKESKYEKLQNRIMRVWFKNPCWDGIYPELQYIDEIAQEYYFVEFIDLPDGDVLIGMEELTDKNAEYINIDYYKLSEIHFSYYENIYRE